MLLSMAMLPSSGLTEGGLMESALTESAPGPRLLGPRCGARSRNHVRRHRAAWWGGMFVSVLVHILVLLLWPDATIVLERVQGSDALPIFDRSDPVRLVRLAIPAEEAVRAEEAVPEVSAPPIVPRRAEIRVREVATSRTASDLTRAEPLSGGPSVALAMHRSASGPPVGEEERFVQPIARAILPNWRTPRSLHGLVATARVHVDPTGKPTGLVELVRSTSNRQLNREIAYRARRLQYEPARRNGEPVAAWAEITFVFCHTGVTATSPAPPRPPEAPCNSNGSKGLESR